MTKGAKQHDNQVESLKRMKKTIKISKITKNSKMTKIVEKNFQNITKDLGDQKHEGMNLVHLKMLMKNNFDSKF
jgi:ABC-type ATPase with predicted acetyltransferase domain